MSMERFLSVFRSRTSVGIIGVGAILGLFSWFGFFVLGVIAAAIFAAVKSGSGRIQWMERVSSYAGVRDQARFADLEQLTTQLKAARMTRGAEQFGIQAHDQLQSAGEKYSAFRELLDQKFDLAELTHGRYAKSADQVFLSILDDLQKATTMLKGVGAVDVDQVRAQVRLLNRKETPSEAEQRELSTLEERLGIREQELESVRELLSDNEAALTKITLASAELARLETQAGRADVDSNDAMKQLEELAKRLERYGIDRP